MAHGRALPGAAGPAGLLRASAIAPTAEQRIRGLADAQADGILLLNGYDTQALSAAAGKLLQHANGAQGAMQGLYTLSLSMLPADALESEG